jgi:hypothetical protein
MRWDGMEVKERRRKWDGLYMGIFWILGTYSMKLSVVIHGWGCWNKGPARYFTMVCKFWNDEFWKRDFVSLVGYAVLL